MTLEKPEQFVRLVSKPGMWYDDGTEVFDATVCDWGRKHRRITVQEFDQWKLPGHILALGLRNGFWDEELCPLEEFDITIVEEQV